MGFMLRKQGLKWKSGMAFLQMPCLKHTQRGAAATE